MRAVNSALYSKIKNNAYHSNFYIICLLTNIARSGNVNKYSIS